MEFVYKQLRNKCYDMFSFLVNLGRSSERNQISLTTTTGLLIRLQVNVSGWLEENLSRYRPVLFTSGLSVNVIKTCRSGARIWTSCKHITMSLFDANIAGMGLFCGCFL